MKKILNTIVIAAISAMTSAHADIPTASKHIAYFCGADGHEDGSPGYGEWLKQQLDSARARGLGDAVALSFMRTVLCDIPTHQDKSTKSQ